MKQISNIVNNSNYSVLPILIRESFIWSCQGSMYNKVYKLIYSHMIIDKISKVKVHIKINTSYYKLCLYKHFYFPSIKHTATPLPYLHYYLLKQIFFMIMAGTYKNILKHLIIFNNLFTQHNSLKKITN